MRSSGRIRYRRLQHRPAILLHPLCEHGLGPMHGRRQVERGAALKLQPRATGSVISAAAAAVKWAVGRPAHTATWPHNALPTVRDPNITATKKSTGRAPPSRAERLAPRHLGWPTPKSMKCRRVRLPRVRPTAAAPGRTESMRRRCRSRPPRQDDPARDAASEAAARKRRRRHPPRSRRAGARKAPGRLRSDAGQPEAVAPSRRWPTTKKPAARISVARRCGL